MLGNSGVIMAQYYSIILRFQGSGTRGPVDHPGSTELSRMMRSEIIRSVEQGDGDGDAETIMAPLGAALGG